MSLNSAYFLDHIKCKFKFVAVIFFVVPLAFNVNGSLVLSVSAFWFQNYIKYVVH